MLLDRDLEIINKIYRLQPDRTEPPTVDNLKLLITEINATINKYLHESKFEVVIPVFDRTFTVKYGLRMARSTSNKDIVSNDVLDRMMLLAGVHYNEFEQGVPAFVVQQHVLSDNLSELRFDETIENNTLVNKLLEDHFASMVFKGSNVHELIEKYVDVEHYFTEEQKAALVRAYVVTDIALNLANSLLEEIHDEGAAKARANFVEYKRKKQLAEQKAITANYIKHRQDCIVEPLSLSELSENMTDDEKNDKWVQIKDEAIDQSQLAPVKGTYDKRKDKHLLSEIDSYLYKIRSNCAGVHYTDREHIVNNIRARLSVPHHAHQLVCWDNSEVERLERIKQFLRLVHLIAHKASYVFDKIDEIPLCHLHADGSFTDDNYMKEIINVCLTTGELLPEDINHIHKCYSDKSIVVGLKMVAKSDDERPVMKLKVEDEKDSNGLLPPIVLHWSTRASDDGYKPYLSDFA